MTNLSSRVKHLIQKSQPLDQVAILLMVVLTVLIAGLLLSGDRTTPRVREFSWHNQQISATDTGFILYFNRPMQRESVERNLRIDPPLSGKISWAGRRMAYTLVEPPPYGTLFTLQLQDASDQLYGNQAGRVIQPYTSNFRTRDRAFAYIGIQGEAEGRLMLVNLSKDNPAPIALTPPDVIVLEFEPYPSGDRILYSAISRSDQLEGQFDPKLFTVTTGMNSNELQNNRKRIQPAGQVEMVLDSKNYRNLKFDLSPDGKTVVVQRVNKENPADFSPWIIASGKSPKPLQSEGGDFLIGPDSQSLLIAQGPDLTTILPLEPGAEPLEYLPKFGQVLGFTRDGSAATMVRFNSDGTRSLFLVNNQGEEQELYRTPPFGNIMSAQFDPTNTLLYCLLTELLDNQSQYQEQPYIAAINLKSKELIPLVILPNQQEINMSLSPDGLGLLFDQAVTTKSSTADSENSTRTEGGDSITTSRLWLLPLDIKLNQSRTQLQPEELPFLGFNPRWFP